MCWRVRPQQSLVYGEVDFAPFVAVLQQLQVPMAAKFVDLGSGCGKALLAVRCSGWLVL